MVEGWLAPDGAEKPRLPHGSLTTLLALYGQLFESNLKVDPAMQGGSFDLDLPALARTTGRPVEKVELTLKRLRKIGLFRKSGDVLYAHDPVSKAWPPTSFAMLPVRYVIAKLEEIRAAAARERVKTGDVLALYWALVVQRNHRTEEVWFSKEKTSAKAGIAPDEGLKCLGALMRARIVVRAGLATYKYLLLGFEASEQS